MNMVRVGVVDHPRIWGHGGYVEIQNTRRKCILIDYEKLCHLAGYSVFERLLNSTATFSAPSISTLV